MQIEVSEELAGQVAAVTSQCLHNLSEVLDHEHRESKAVQSAAWAVTACANLWQAIGKYGAEEQTVILTRAETREHLMAWAEKVGAVVTVGGTA